MKKRLLASLLAVVMLLGLLPTAAFAAEGDGTTDTTVTTPKVENSSDAVKITKTVSETEKDGVYEITMEAYVTGQVQAAQGTPLDIVLVLDQSGSMAFGQSSNSNRPSSQNRKDALVAAVNGFVESIAENAVEYSVDHRIAIVGYAASKSSGRSNGSISDYPINGSTDYWVNTGLYVNGEFKNYETLDTYQEVFGPNMNKSNTYYIWSTPHYQPITWSDSENSWGYKGSLLGYWNPVTPKTSENDWAYGHSQVYEFVSGGPLTAQDYKDALVSVYDSNTEQVTDSITTAINKLAASGGTYTEYGLEMAKKVFDNNAAGSGRQRVVVLFTDGNTNSGINTVLTHANALKDTGYNATIFTVGLYPNTAAETFLDYISSNYTSASYNNHSEQYSGIKAETDTDYSKSAGKEGGADLSDVFREIAGSIQPTIEVGEDAVLTDTVSNFFAPEGVRADDTGKVTSGVTVYKVAAAGNDKDTLTWAEQREEINNASVTLNDQTVNVSGFDYSADENLVHFDTSNQVWTGYKLVLVFQVKLDESKLTAGSQQYETNEAASLKDEEGKDIAEATLEESPKIQLIAYTVTYSIQAPEGTSIPSDSGAYLARRTVTLKPAPTVPGYEFSGYTVTYKDVSGEDKNVTVTTSGANVQTFIMPAANVTISGNYTATDKSVSIVKELTSVKRNNVELGKTDDDIYTAPNKVQIGDVLTYTVTVTNTGTFTPLTNVVFHDTLSNLTLEETTGVSAAVNTTSGTDFTVSSISSGTPVTFSYTYTVAGDDIGNDGKLTNTVTATNENIDDGDGGKVEIPVEEKTYVWNFYEIGSGEHVTIYRLDSDGSYVEIAKGTLDNPKWVYGVDTLTKVTFYAVPDEGYKLTAVKGCEFKEPVAELSETQLHDGEYFTKTITIDGQTYSAWEFYYTDTTSDTYHNRYFKVTTQEIPEPEKPVLEDLEKSTSVTSVRANQPITYTISFKTDAQNFSIADDKLPSSANAVTVKVGDIEITTGEIKDGVLTVENINSDKDKVTVTVTYTYTPETDGLVTNKATVNVWNSDDPTNKTEAEDSADPVQVGDVSKLPVTAAPANVTWLTEDEEEPDFALVEKKDNTYSITTDKAVNILYAVSLPEAAGKSTWEVTDTNPNATLVGYSVEADTEISCTVKDANTAQINIPEGKTAAVTVYFMMTVQPSTTVTNSATVKDVTDPDNPVEKPNVDSPDVTVIEPTPNNYTITASADAGGNITPSGRVPVNEGEDKTFTISANDGYKIDKLIVDSVSIENPGSSYTFRNVSGNHTIRVTFTKISTVAPTTPSVVYHSNFGKDVTRSDASGTIKWPSELPSFPLRNGYTFVVWNTQKDGSGTNYQPGKRVTLTSDLVLYAQWKRDTSSPDSTGVSGLLNTGDHIQYLFGYPDGTFGPTRNMTRAEAAQMFYNLLLNQNVRKTVTFSDVDGSEWFADAVHTMASLGVLKGYPDGTFQPNKPITRAEFTTMAMQFTRQDQTGSSSFSDVSLSDWFYTFVVGASKYGWISGYPDGTFKPNANITRAEVTSIVNSMLGRYADEDYVDRYPNRINSFTDLKDSYWAYYPIMEATNEHDYSKGNQTEDWSHVTHR